MPRLKTPRLVTGTRIAVASELYMAGCKVLGKNIQLTQIGLTVEFNHERKRRGRHKYFCPQWRMAPIR